MKLIVAACHARRAAHAPYSMYTVGSALEAADGRIFTGCNIENSSYGATVCAERVAFFKAISEGVREFRALAVATAASTPAPPCGLCRQALSEFCGPELEIILCGPTPDSYPLRRFFFGDLFPHPFNPSSLL